MKPIDVTPSAYFEFDKNYKEDPEFKADDHVRISKLKSIFGKVYISNRSEIGFTKVKNTLPWIFLTNNLK